MKKVMAIGIIGMFLLTGLSSLSVLGIETRIINGDNNEKTNDCITKSINLDHPPVLSEGIVFPETVTQYTRFRKR